MTGAAWRTAVEAEVPDADDWLSPAGRAVLAGLRFERRRRAWRLGRWVATRVVAAALGADPADVDVVAALGGAPEALLRGRPAPVAISISHRAGVGACLVAPAAMPAGCDLELVEPRDAGFVRDYLTAGEQALVVTAGAERRDLAVTLVWSAKESALKALREGLRMDTRDVEVACDLDAEAADGWRPLSVRHAGGAFAGWWRRLDGDLVLTAVVERGSPPRHL